MREVLAEDYTDLEGVAKAVFPPEKPTKDPDQERADKERELALQKKLLQLESTRQWNK